MEQKHLVCQGATCQCKFGNAPDKLKVLTQTKTFINEEEPQEKLVATTADVGATFEKNTFGLCQMQPLPGGGYKPCQIMIAQWSGAYENITYEENNGHPLLEDSKATCPIGDKDCISIINHGQVAEITNRNLHSADPIKMDMINPFMDFATFRNKEEDKLNKTSFFIEDAYWVDEKGEKTHLMPIKTNKMLFFIKFKDEAINKQFKMELKSLDPIIDDDLLVKTNCYVSSLLMKIEIDISGKIFVKGNDPIQKLYCKIEIEGNKYSYPSSEKDYLVVHAIHYIPQVMRAQSPPWEVAARCQERWFSKELARKPNYSDPVTDILTIDWVFKYSRVHPFFKKITGKLWETEKSKQLFCQRLREMYNYIDPITKKRDLDLPIIVNSSKEFGYFDNSVFRMNNENIKTTLLDRYYINEVPFVGSTSDNLDDLYGAVGNFIFRITPKGIITYLGYDKYKVQYSQIAVYFIDSFDFQDDNSKISQPLGFWDINNNTISKKNPFGSFYINNNSYNKYQKDYNKGGDYMNISNYDVIEIYDEFSFNILRYPKYNYFTLLNN